jgi:hypothetical protein
MRRFRSSTLTPFPLAQSTPTAVAQRNIESVAIDAFLVRCLFIGSQAGVFLVRLTVLILTAR